MRKIVYDEIKGHDMKSLQKLMLCVVFLGFSLSFTHCGSSSCNLTDQPCACDKRSTSAGTCIDSDGGQVDNARTNCTEDSGTFSDSGLCSTSGRVGTCKVSVLTNTSYIRYYSNAVTAQAACLTTGLSVFGIPGVTGEWVAD